MEMEHEDFAGSQFCSIWESFSSDECGSGASSLNLPELCNSPDHNDNGSWLPPPSSSQIFHSKPATALALDNHHHHHQNLDRIIDSFPSPSTSSSHHHTLISSPDSPLVFNFLLPQHQHSSSSIQFGFPPVQLLQSPEEVIPSKPCVKTPPKSSKASSSSSLNQNSSSSSMVVLENHCARIKKERAEVQDENCPAWKKKCLESRGLESRTKSSVTLSAPEESSTVTSALGPALNTDGKPRAKRGSATDPQSIYARQRRERINERLRALQGLVPNGAKVDIVTMLEEAINYVKFLQLQVKLLSSDEYWMYAPTNYNGMNISLGMHLNMQSYLKIKENVSR